MSNVKYKTPHRLSSTFGVISDAILNIAANQYGGFSVSEIDKLLIPYIEKSYNIYYKEYISIYNEISELTVDNVTSELHEKADKYATEKIKKDLYAGFQQLEYKLNTVASSRGDFSFVTVSFGLSTNKWAKMASEIMMDVRKKGQGEPAVPMLFPKLVFLTNLETLHGEGKPNRDLFLKACECSSECMYPDFVSLDSANGTNYLGEVYKKYGKAITPMGKELIR